MNKRILNIDFLKIILMFSIIIFHLFQKVHLGEFFPNWCYKTHFGDKAVEMFFIISGFFLGCTFKNTTSIFCFIAKKFIRFAPTLMLVLLISWLLSCFTDFIFLKYENIFDLLLLNNLGITLRPGNIGDSWFISVLVFVSLFYFCLLKYLKRTHANLVIGLITYFSFVVLVNITHGSLGGISKIYYNIINVGMLRGLSCIGLGYLIYTLYDYLKPVIQKNKISIKTTLIFTFLEIYLFIFLINNLIFHRFSFNNKIVLVIAFAVLFYLFLLNFGLLSKFAGHNLFSKISKYTFSIYITHLCVYKILSYTLWTSDINMKIVAILTILIAICIGIATYHIVEKPCTNYFLDKLYTLEKKREQYFASLDINFKNNQLKG